MLCFSFFEFSQKCLKSFLRGGETTIKKYWLVFKILTKTMVFSHKIKNRWKKLCTFYKKWNFLKNHQSGSVLSRTKYWLVFDIFSKNMVFFSKNWKTAEKKLRYFFNILFFWVFQQQKNNYLSKEDTKHPEQNIE